MRQLNKLCLPRWLLTQQPAAMWPSAWCLPHMPHPVQHLTRASLPPETARPAGIKANTKDGVLRLTVPKTEAAKPKQIDIQVSE